jgi:hypothetical protein
MAYKIDPYVLHKVAKQVVGMLLKGRELITHSTELLSNEYPDLIDPMPGPLSRQQGGRHPRRGPFSLLQPPASTS